MSVSVASVSSRDCNRGPGNGVGFSASVRHQSGWPYALIQQVDIPGVGTNRPIFLSNLSANRSENVTLVDLRVERVLDVGPAAGSR